MYVLYAEYVSGFKQKYCRNISVRSSNVLAVGVEYCVR